MRYKAKRDAKGHFIPVITNRVKLCKFCGKEFTPSIKNWARNKFCSASCASKSHPSGRKGKIGGKHQKDMVRLKLSGKNHWKWIENRTEVLEKHRIRGLVEIKYWRDKVFIRDNYTCQTCGIRGGRLEAHHIKRWADYPKLRYVVSNGITLCRTCHLKTFKNK
jgi:hypothetical protein